MKILDNGIAVIEGDDWISRWVQESGRLDHDQNLLPVILPYIQEGDYVLDGGAFIGDHTIAYLKAVGNGGKVFAFEPNPEAFECLRFNCPEAICYNLGLGKYQETLSLCKGGANHGASFLDCYLSHDSSVTVTNIDSLSLPHLDFLKLDIEGMEKEAIAGAYNTIRKHKPVILLEINVTALQRNHMDAEGLIYYVESLGYKHKKVYESDELDMPQFDLLFLPL